MPPKPVVFIPGLPASELLLQPAGQTIFPPSLADLLNSGNKKRLVALLSEDPPRRDILAGQPVRRVTAIAKQAESLYDILRQHYGYTIDGGDNFRAIGWDWRLGVDDASVQNAIVSAIDTLFQAAGRRVVVVLHSTGGLVFRALIESQPQIADRVEAILAFGVPWAGNLKAFRYLTRGESLGPFFARLTAAQTRSVLRMAQAAYDLCPPDPAKTTLTDADGRALDLVTDPGGAPIGPMVTTSWIPSGNRQMESRALAADRRLGTRPHAITIAGRPTPPITNVAGWGVETEVRCVIDAGGGVTFNPPRRGRPVGDEKDGDGTVALKAGAWLRGDGVRTFYVPIGIYPTAGYPSPHPRIWDSPPVRQLFDEVLNGVAPDVFVCASADSDQAIDRQSDVTLRLSAAGPDGSPLPDARATIRLASTSPAFLFGGEVRRDIILRRGSMQGNAARDLFRFTIDVAWDGGRRELPMLIRV